MYKRESFKINLVFSEWHNPYYALIPGTDTYLFEPGRLVNWSKALNEYGNTEANKRVYFSSREELEKCLDIYLKGQEMNIDEIIAQCEKNILEEQKRHTRELAAHYIELNELLEEKKHKWKHGDVFSFARGVNSGIMVYVNCYGENAYVFYLNTNFHTLESLEYYLKTAKFLFNIKEKI